MESLTIIVFLYQTFHREQFKGEASIIFPKSLRRCQMESLTIFVFLYQTFHREQFKGEASKTFP